MLRGGFNFIFAVSVLIGAIVGAGIFALPYAISRSGIVPGFFYFFILGGAALLMHLFLAEISLRTEGAYGLAGFCRKYLGGFGKIAIAVSIVVGTTGSLLAYLILAGDFLKILFSPILNQPVFYFTFIFWLLSSFFIFRGAKLVAPLEFLTNCLFFLVIAIIFIFALPRFNLPNITLFNSSNVFLPYGVIMFSLVGWSALPEVIAILKKPEEKKLVKKVIVIASLIVLIFYFLFVLAVLGVAGGNVSQDTISGLLPYLGSKIIFLGALAGAITIADSFLVLAIYLKNTLIHDFKLGKTAASLSASFLPFILYLIGLRSFITVIGIVGAIIGVIEGVIIILIFQKAKKMGDRVPEFSLKAPKALLVFLVLIFILGAIAQIFFV